MVALIAKMKIKEGRMDEATDLFRDLVPKVGKEEGTLGYAVCRDKANPNLLVVVERYRGMEAIQAHSSTPHFKEFSKAVGALLDGKPDITILEEIFSI
ncbi:MAG: antibiotic biosynthesis monooxygenase [Deltaproteobacteria bacterium]|nr:antibiotic biosynthesis monooxygenase [Deltaproteobacteria bacterium]